MTPRGFYAAETKSKPYDKSPAALVSYKREKISCIFLGLNRC